jgi:hypothetical protein
VARCVASFGTLHNVTRPSITLTVTMVLHMGMDYVKALWRNIRISPRVYHRESWKSLHGGGDFGALLEHVGAKLFVTVRVR